MLELLNPALNLSAIAAELGSKGLVQIDNYLDASTAAQLHASLDREVAWDLAWSDQGAGRLIKASALATMGPAAIRSTVAPAFDQQAGSFRFVYNTFRVIDSWQAQQYPQHTLYNVANAMHEARHLDHVRTMTDCPAITRMDIIAARYLPGHFLTPHDDAHPGEGREVTWILNLTRDWQAQWGGLLHLMDSDQQRITHSFIPRYNSMILFRPPLWHFVSQVANFARLPRYTLTGWMLST